MTAIHELDTDRSPAEVWRDLRAGAKVSAEPVTVMVVEDDAEAAADLTELLTDAGHRVVGPFHSAAAAEAAAALHSIDVALLDINLSGAGSGVDLARVLAERWSVRVAFLSGDVTAAARHADLADALVLKPYTGSQVLETVSRLGEPG